MAIKKDNKTQEMSVPLLVGEGKGPPTNTRRVPPKPEASEVPPEMEASEGADSDAEKKEDSKEKTQTYWERLKAADITETHAREVMDAVLFENDYRETIYLRENFPVVLHTRAYEDTLRLMRVVEAENPTFPMHVNDIIARYNVCASLVQYGNKIITLPAEDATSQEIEENFEARLNFIFGLREIAISKLINLVARFDKKMAVIFSEGAIEDF